MRSYSRRANTVTMHSDLIQVIVIIWAIQMCWLQQQVGNKSKHWEEGSLLGVLWWSQSSVGKYPPVWRCVGCQPVAADALALYEQKKQLFLIGLSNTISFILHAPTHFFGMWCWFLHVCTHTYTHACTHACMSLRGGSGAQFPTLIPSSCLPRLRKHTHSFVWWWLLLLLSKVV